MITKNNTIIIDKKLDNDNICFKLLYGGEIIDNYYDSNCDNLVDNYMDLDHNDIILDINSIRTILADFPEEKLAIQFNDKGRNIIKEIVFDKGILAYCKYNMNAKDISNNNYLEKVSYETTSMLEEVISLENLSYDSSQNGLSYIEYTFDLEQDMDFDYNMFVTMIENTKFYKKLSTEYNISSINDAFRLSISKFGREAKIYLISNNIKKVKTKKKKLL